MQQSHGESRPRHLIWDTGQTRPAEQFAYYREAICQAFMNLTPEAPPATQFQAKVESIRLLRKRGLTVAAVAASVGISERYVHKLLELSGTTFSDYVMERRLDGAAADLKNPDLAERDIGAIAFDWGFSDLSHFTRRFKQRFGCRPRDWRGRRD